MNLLKYGIGLDVAMEKVAACISFIDVEQRVRIKASSEFKNDKTGFEKLLTWAKKITGSSLPVVYLMEATGVYYEQMAWFLYEKQCKVSVVLPNKAKKYKESLGLRSKTDRIDATGLAKMACEQAFDPWVPFSKNIYMLRMITRQIQNLTEQATAISNQLHALRLGMFRDKSIEKMHTSQVNLLEKQKETLIARLKSTIEADDFLREKFKKITRIKGLGWLNLAVLVAETNGFSSFQNAGQLVSYAGYDVIANESGKHTGKTRISKQGNSRIRRCLHFPALNVVRYGVGPFKNFYDRIFDRTRIKMKAYTAVQKKLLVIIYALWKKDEAFVEKVPEKTSGDAELAPSFASTPKELKKNNPGSTRVTQDRHPSKSRRMPSFAESKVRKK